ncbi:MAG: dihydrofolate reductase [Firmicutes bacterium]|nr:dihydrofolate reductase [Bacillota bacterium]
MINIIAAVGRNLELGKDNKLLWNLPEDMKYFKETTMGHTVVMGKKTYKSIGKVLPGRRNIVLSSSLEDPKVEVVNSIDDILNFANDEDLFIIGGASVYKQFLPFAQNLYLTLVDDAPSADVYFPDFNEDLYEKEIIKEIEENNIKLTFVIYRRKING